MYSKWKDTVAVRLPSIGPHVSFPQLLNEAFGVYNRIYHVNIRFPAGAGKGVPLSTTASIRVVGPTLPPVHGAPRETSLEIRRPGRDINHLPPSSAES